MAVWDPDGAGPLSPRLVAAGYFLFAGSEHTKGVATWDGAQWRPLGDGTDGTVYALAVYQGDLYAAGQFGFAAGGPRGIARWDGTTWRPVVNMTTQKGLNDYANCLAVYNNELVVGGHFTEAGGTGAAYTASRIAKWNGVSWSSLGNGTANGVGNGDVNALAVFNGALYAGGAFTTAGGVSSPALASWNGSSWQQNPVTGFVGSINAFSVFNSTLIFGGNFAFNPGSGGGALNYIGGWTGSAIQRLGGGMDGPVYALKAFAGQLIAAGGFSHANSNAANQIAAWNPSLANWQALGTGVTSANSLLRALEEYDGKLFAAGQCWTVGGKDVRMIAAWDATEWRAVGHGVNDQVVCFASYNNSLIAGGLQTRADGEACGRVTRLLGVSWQPVGAGLGLGFGTAAVSEMASYSGSLVAGGNFDRVVGGAVIGALAKWNGSSWQGFDPLPASATWYEVRAILADQSDLYVGGLTSGGGTGNRVMKWNGIQWQQLGGQFNGDVNTIIKSGSDIIAAGTIGPTSSDIVARWNGTSWAPIGDSFGGRVYNVAVYQGSLYAAGTFTSVGAQSCNRIAKWNGTQWQPVDVGVNGTILAMAVYNNELYVGGQFSTAGGPSSTALNIARWNGSFWSALSPDGVSGGNPVGVNSLYVWNNQLFVGGAFDSAGGTVSRMVARWGCPCYANCDNSTIAPVLNVNDYVCFLSSFVAGSPYANCDASTTSPVLNILDYTCFMSKFASGCP